MIRPVALPSGVVVDVDGVVVARRVRDNETMNCKPKIWPAYRLLYRNGDELFFGAIPGDVDFLDGYFRGLARK